MTKEIVQRIKKWIMSNYNALKNAIINAVYENGENEITGQALQDVLLAIVNSLGAGYQYIGVITPQTNPNTPDQRVFGVASSGTYPNFGVTVEDGCIGFIRYDENGWTLEQLKIQSDIYKVEEDGFYFVDSDGNIAMSINNNGLGFAKITQSTISYLNSVLNTGGEKELITVEEDGFFIVDLNGNICLSVNGNGLNAINLGDQIKTEKVSDVEYDINI